MPDYSSIFTQFWDEENLDSKSDFAAQLAGFMASLLIDVPSQAHWIMELTKYNFGGAAGHLVASVPGIHFYRTPHPSKFMKFAPVSIVRFTSLHVLVLFFSWILKNVQFPEGSAYG